jgi:glycosyltransferase involved in cell wall biosynthesis
LVGNESNVKKAGLKMAECLEGPKGRIYVEHAENALIAPCGKTWTVMTTQYTLFIAHLIEERLKAHGWDVEIVAEAPAYFDRDWYVILCPQMFKLLPPAEKRIIYQLEQSVSSRWFTAEYINILKDSFAVLDYASVNIDFLKQIGIINSRVHYLPVGSSERYGSKIIEKDKTFDVLFYGEITAGRQRMLSALQEHFDVCVASDVFGERIQELIKSARIVINLHFYENALLETTRIQECLSLGVPVVSEYAQDQGDYPEIAGGVIYFKEGSIEEMLIAVQYALDNPISLESIRSAVNLGASRFALMFDEFLVKSGLLGNPPG